MSPSTRLRLFCLLITTLASFASVFVFARNNDGDRTGAGTTIYNQAEGTYADDSGVIHETVSSIVTIKVLAISKLITTPDENEPSAEVGPNDRITRTFKVCNSGNIADLYTITHVDLTSPATLINLYFDLDANGTVSPNDVLIGLNQTKSSRVDSGGCIGVLVVVDTKDFPAKNNLTIHLGARSNVADAVNGTVEDDGTIVNAVGAAPRLTNPNDTNLPPSKLVNGAGQVVVAAGVPVTYTVSFRNSGETPAREVTMIDELPGELNYLPGSLRLADRGLTDVDDTDEGTIQGRQLKIHLTELVPDQVVNIEFKATISASVPAGVGVINTAKISGQNFPPVTSSTATAVIDPFGTVFAGRGGSAAPIAGAKLELMIDQTGSSILQIPTGSGFLPNAANDNPFVSDGMGHFSFVLSPTQTGSASISARYFMRVTAPGYLTRMLELATMPGDSGLFALKVTALDGAPLARAGGFDLVRDAVGVEDAAAIALNIPMFEQHGLELSKTVDRQQAEIGDVVTYHIEVHNPTAAPAADVTVHDQLPASFVYVAGTARLSLGGQTSVAIEPEGSKTNLLFHLGTIAPGASGQLLYRVRIGANARTGEQQNVASATGDFPSGERSSTTPAHASVFVGGGVFSTRQFIVGRVFVDNNGNGKFDDPDKPMAGVRLYLSSGESVTTDSQGLYSIPSLGDGQQVLSLDPVSLPHQYSVAAGGSISNRSWVRLLRTPLGGGMMLHQNFALTKQADDSNTLSSTTVSSFDKNNDEATSKAKTAPTPVSSVEPDAQGKEQRRPLTPGTYEIISTEKLAPFVMGDVQIVSPRPNTVVMTPAMELDARVALNWTVKVEVNNKLVSDKSIGTTKQDQRNQVTTYTFVGIDLHPGINNLRLTPIAPDGAIGKPQEFAVLGRGPAKRVEIVPEKSEVQAGGRDFTVLHVKAFDQWNNPALDDQIEVDVSAGQLERVNSTSVDPVPSVFSSQAAKGAAVSGTSRPSSESNTQVRQMVVQMNNGEAVVKLIGAGAPGPAVVHAQMGKPESQTELRFIPEKRPAILVGMAEMTFGQSLPEVALNNEEGNFRKRLSLFYSGQLWGDNALTFAYDSQRPINRTAGRNQLFQPDPLDRVYPLFGDSSSVLQAAPANSKLYVRIDHNRSYAMFGDFDTDMEDLTLTGYSRKLTGVKLHMENSGGSFVTVTGARPDTAYARDVFPADGIGVLHLSHGEILPGSETVALEIRDRRNPELILSRETMARSVDYNLDAGTGELFFLRYVSAFDYDLNLTQIVVSYEHRADSISSAVYTARARKSFAGMGLKLGFSGVMQRQENTGSFVLTGIDAEKRLPHNGILRLAIARSQGEIDGGGNYFDQGITSHNGNAWSLELEQPLPIWEAAVHAKFAAASAGYFNPFGTTVTPGSRRGEMFVDFKPFSASTLRLGMVDERNHTDLVDNSRVTVSARWEQAINDRLRLRLGFDHRHYSDELAGNSTDSNLVTASADMKVTDKLQVAAKREQNLGDADPTYPDQTTLSATYQVSKWAKMFVTERLASAAITPIADLSQGGFTGTSARQETAFGMETRLSKYTSMISRYQIENGIDGTDSFAIIGLQNRLPITKKLSLELGLEHSFHLAGLADSYNSATVGFGWAPSSDFRASARYELRDRSGLGELMAIGAAGRISSGITAMSRFQLAKSDFQGRSASSMTGIAALAIRPVESDRVGLLFSLDHRSTTTDGLENLGLTRQRLDSLSTDGYIQATNRLELLGHVAIRFTSDGQPDLPFVSTLSYLTQARAQFRLTKRLDWAGEMRMLIQPASGTSRSSYGMELGVWALPDLRMGIGYNFNASKDPGTQLLQTPKRGFYFSISSKLSSRFDLFGSRNDALSGTGSDEKEKGDAKP